MVYRITQTGSNTALKASLIYFFTRWCLYALICYTCFGFLDMTATYTPWLMLSMALPAALVAALRYRHFRKNTRSYSQTFYTLTEGGVMIETDNGQMAVYIPWAEVSAAHRVLHHTVYLQLTNGKSLNCLLEGLPEARITEFAEFAAAHAGTTPDRRLLTPPPAGLLESEPLRFSATPEQCRELVDTRALTTGRAWVWTWLYPGLLLLWGVLFLIFAYKAEYLVLAIIACFIWKYAGKLLRPGGGNAQLSHMRPARFYTERDQLLVITEGRNSWVLNRQLAPIARYQLSHGTCVAYADAAFMIDPGQELPPFLQAPLRQAPRLLPRMLTGILLGALLLGAAYCFTLSNTWRLHRLLNQETPDIPTALSLARLPESTQVTSVTAMAADGANILLHRKPAPARYSAAALYFELANGDSIYAGFNQYGKLIRREINSATR
ncbi:MAG: hypothetical protein IJE88_07305 [Akkermansia sp.]|nr:hypothetical protein [Akkermansia sp.]